jgi:hypothetical protein
MRVVALLPLLAACGVPHPVTAAQLHDAQFEASVSPRGLAAYFRFPEDMGCPELSAYLHATVNGREVKLTSPQPDPDAYPRGTPCEGYQLEVDAPGETSADIHIWDRTGDVRVTIDSAFAQRHVAWGTPARAAGDVGHLAWSPASDRVTAGALHLTHAGALVPLDVDGSTVRFRVPDDVATVDAVTGTLTASVPVDTCIGFASCAATTSVDVAQAVASR